VIEESVQATGDQERFRLCLTPAQLVARARAVRQYPEKPPFLKRLAQQLDVLPVLLEWTSFLAIDAEGTCLWIDHDNEQGRREPASGLQELSLAIVGAARVPGLEAVLPPRPEGRSDCPHCEGRGSITLPGRDASGEPTQVTVGCHCGGLGWLPLNPEELGWVRVGVG
jgi:hypothetical protein